MFVSLMLICKILLPHFEGLQSLNSKWNSINPRNYQPIFCTYTLTEYHKTSIKACHTTTYPLERSISYPFEVPSNHFDGTGMKETERGRKRKNGTQILSSSLVFFQPYFPNGKLCENHNGMLAYLWQSFGNANVFFGSKILIV